MSDSPKYCQMIEAPTTEEDVVEFQKVCMEATRRIVNYYVQVFDISEEQARVVLYNLEHMSPEELLEKLPAVLEKFELEKNSND